MNAFQLMKQGNYMRVLRLLRESPHSRAELSRRTGLTKAAITGITASLISDSVIREGETTPSEKGRRPVMLELSPDVYRAVGIDISRAGVRLCFTDLNMRPVYERAWSAEQNRNSVLQELTSVIRVAKEQYHFLGIGVVAPAPLDSENGLILTPSRLESWHGFSVRTLEEELELPTILKKDASALAITEKSVGCTDDTFLVILADHGLGSGYIYNRRLFTPSGLGCEIGHLSIDADGIRCSCGSRGCAEAYASIPSALKKAREIFGKISWDELISLAKDGNGRALNILSVQADALATACVSVVNLLEPSSIILEGELCLWWEFFAERIEKALSLCCFSEHGRNVHVMPSALSHNGRMIAAANLILEEFFEGEEYDRIGKM